MAPRSLQFSSFTLDLDRMCLHGLAGKADLRPKSFEVLRYLVEHSGRVIGKEEVINAVWSDVTVTDESLTRCISEVRRAIGDRSQQVIKTVPRRGYLLDVPVSAGEVTTMTAPLVTETGAADDLPPWADQIHKHETPRIDENAFAGERKHVTVLCADLMGSLELAAQRDPEKALEIFEAVLPLMTQSVQRYEGTVNVTTGDGIVALFGAPLAHEDHAIRACYAALQMQEAVNQYAREGHNETRPPILLRAGLHSGEAVIRPIADDPSGAYRAMGPTVHVAARLGQSAAPGTLLVSAETLRLAKGFVHVKPVVPADMAGHRESTYELVGAVPVQTSFQARAAYGLTGFVGRDAEMEQLERVRARILQRHGQVVAIIGEPGLGKSRLLYEFIHSSGTSHWRLIEAASASYRRATSYQPVIDLLKAYFKIEVGDNVREVRNKVVDQLTELDPELAPDVSALLTLLDVPGEEPSWQALDSFQRRQRTLDALKRLVLRECQQQPVILTFEDLHWIDGETQAFLDTLIDGLASAPLLLILTYRPEYEHRWGRKSYYTQLRLDVLSPETTEEFLRHLVGDDASLVRLKELLLNQGTPFFLEETVRALVEMNLLEGDRGAYRLINPLENLPIPPTVQAILAARIDRLPARSKRLLHAASVVGKEVPHEILQPIAGLGEEELRRGLAELTEAEFLYEARLFPHTEHKFKHALTHDVAYGSLLGDQRRALHGQIVEVIERLYADRLAEHSVQLAYHAQRGELWEKAVHYFRQAGKKAEALSALQDARAWFEQALGIVRRLPEGRSALEQEFEILLDLRSILIQLAEGERVLEHLREAETRAQKLNDDRRLGQVYAFMTSAHLLCGAPEEAIVTGTRALEIAASLSDLRLRIQATSFLEQGHYHRGEYRQVIDLATDNLAALPAEWVNENLCGTVPSTILDLYFLILCLAHLGRFVEAGERALELLRLAEGTYLPFGLACEAAGTLHLIEGSWTKARLRLEQGISAVKTGNIVNMTNRMIALSAWAFAELGETREALNRLYEGRQLLDHQAARRHLGLLGWSYYVLGRACLTLGRLDDAQGFGDCAVDFSPHHPGFAAHGLHLLGDIKTHPERFDPESGEAHFYRALALAEPRGMHPLIAHCHRGLGRLYLRNREIRKSQEHLAKATAMYRDIGFQKTVSD